MKTLKKSVLLLTLLPLLSIGSVDGAVVAERGGGGDRGAVRDNAAVDVRAAEIRDGVYGAEGVGGGYINPAYGYPGAYPQNYNAFPDDSEQNSIFKANQHPGE